MGTRMGTGQMGRMDMMSEDLLAFVGKGFLWMVGQRARRRWFLV
jgi:hypothetical protein